jgi:ferredoxin
MMGAKDHSHCSGCSLCLLACPVWRQTKDIRLTPHGRAKALQHGASVADLGSSISSCTVCGACEPACPEELPLVELILDLRKQASWGQGRVSASPSGQPIFRKKFDSDPDFRDGVERLLEMKAAEDNGRDIALLIECGLPIPEARLRAFLGKLAGASRLVVGEALLIAPLRRWLPGAEIASLGYALSSLPAVRGKLKASDLYVIESRAFHGDYRNMLGHYDGLRQATGMTTNLDLQRLATPTTANSAQAALGLKTLDAADQARWILEGRSYERVVVEDVADRDVFAGVTDRPVVHLADL